MNKFPAMSALSLRRAASDGEAWDCSWLLINVIRAGLLGALLSGCAQSLPERAEQETPEAASTAPGAAESAGATADPDADEPLPWPPPNGDIPMPQEAAAVGKMFEWHGDGRRVSRIVIDTDTQQARFFDNGELVGWSTVATGVSSHSTPTGEFSVLEKVADKRSNLYGRIYNSEGKLVKRNAKAGRDAVPPGGRFAGARMPHFMRMTFDGVGMHAGPIPRPGSPASHGCIRMPAQVADALFDHVDSGTRVTVIGSTGPDYGNYMARVQSQQKDARARAAASEAEGGPLESLDAEIAALRGEDLPSTSDRSSASETNREEIATEEAATEKPAQERDNNSGATEAESGDARESAPSQAADPVRPPAPVT
ncbi:MULTISPECIES: L,D-transpeptidase [Thiorhodovibrio]|uniref:L,D-transpeptidase n=1 Tax=Thiorhodovibrio TaxID=61593 RepID=UPI001911EC00|nr:MULTISPECIES: L,D-transpeptidase family protein [Thiorhodovibrio]MBK5970429.1 hypothetical protein [Thiorhodovibrio winogradskyi]WPL11447.1 L,D-transpeptidase catalytic domain [Thiorhodovibrio litoralis]